MSRDMQPWFEMRDAYEALKVENAALKQEIELLHEMARSGGEQYVQEIEQLKAGKAALQAFYDYWSQLYGEGLEIANWHQNGDTEAFENFFDEAESRLKQIGGETP